MQFLQPGARFRLHALLLRGEDGADLFRWTGAGELLRGGRGLRTQRCGGSILVECLNEAAELDIALDPRLSSRAVTVLLTVSQAEAASERAPGGGGETDLEARLDEILGRLRILQEDVAASQEQMTAQRRWLERQFELELRRSDMQAEMAELQFRALAKRFGDFEEAQRQLHAIRSSTSWRVTRPLRAAAKVMSGEVSLGYAWRRGVSALITRTPLKPEIKATLRRRLAPGPAPVARQDATADEAAPAGPLVFPPPGQITSLPEVSGSAPEPLDVSVSVVIPTFNAGQEFYWLLRKLGAQRGLRSVEVVVVDSGSSDGTDALAEAFGCKVVRIPNEQFSHSHARNLGADAASGDLLLFMVQDAYPVGDWWLQTLAKVLVEPRREAERLAAVSCAEFPRSDSELLYNALIDTHYRFLGCDRNDRIGAFAGADHESLRAQGQISDVACMMSREIFQAYRYQGRYAEDLILGVRLIRDGLRTGMLSSVRVIHSHNRPSGYYLRRVFVDVIFLIEVFPDFSFQATRSAAAGLMAAGQLKTLVEAWRPRPGALAGEALRGLAAQVREVRFARGARTPPDFGYAPVLPWFERALAEEPAPPKAEAEQLREAYAARLEHLAAFADGAYGEVDDYLAGELSAAARKSLAMSLGAHLAYVYLSQRPTSYGPAAERLDELRDLLLAGI